MTTHVTMTTCITVFPFPPTALQQCLRILSWHPPYCKHILWVWRLAAYLRIVTQYWRYRLILVYCRKGGGSFCIQKWQPGGRKNVPYPTFSLIQQFFIISQKVSHSHQKGTKKPGICGTEWYSSGIPVLLCYVGNATVYRYLVWPVFSWQNWCQYSTDNKGWQTTPGFFQKYHVYIFLQCMSQTL